MSLPAQPPRTPEEFEEALRSEAEFRARSIRQFGELREKLLAQARQIESLSRTLGERNTYVHSLHLEREAENARVRTQLGEKDAYIHTLHLERAGWVRAASEARADVERYVWLAQRLQSDFSHIGTKWIRKLMRSLARRDRTLHGDNEPALPPGDDTYHIEPSPFRVFLREAFVVEGWIRAGSRPISALRVRIRGISHLPGAELTPHGSEPTALAFAIPVRIPVGHSLLRFEAADASGNWRSVLNAPVWRPETP